ncbi:MAG: glucose 1-dehydrogenase [Pseudomonadales bacterium]|nr:glucose 1-dehydrogenase [Pseudomonadales bacterium]
MNNVAGKVAIVSGGARGIGGESARQLAAHGAAVIVADILLDEGETNAETIRQAGGEAQFIKLDVTAAASWENAVAKAVSLFGGVDILVNNAGIYIPKPIMESSEEDFARLIAVNLEGVFLGTKICAPEMMRRAETAKVGSAIVNISSAAGLVGSRNAPIYSMTKGGVRLFTKSTALEFSRKGIRCNSVHPGLIDTPMGGMLLNSRGSEGSNDVRAAIANSHPIGRIGEDTDIAAAVVFLASDDAAFITGAELAVDGGVTAI